MSRDQVKRQEREAREAKRAAFERAIASGEVIVRWARPGELPEPARRSIEEGKRLSARTMPRMP